MDRIRIFEYSQVLRCAVNRLDDGPGIPPEDLPRIFYRADKARTNDGSMHAGLGLSIVKAIVDADGGAFSCESVVGHGPKFIVKLPRQRNL